MALQRITGSQMPAPQPPDLTPYELKVDGMTKIEQVHQRLVAMWAHVLNEQVFENPTLLQNFFGEYAAYVGFYASMVDELYRRTTDLVEQTTNQIYEDHKDESATFLDGLIRRTERHISKELTFHERELKAFNNNINSIQTKLRIHSEHLKMGV